MQRYKLYLYNAIPKYYYINTLPSKFKNSYTFTGFHIVICCC